ncbi:MAG: dienelactone hydrolase family protein [Rhodospirillaceae bacterium]|nr:dienelactone hydrolase family protein [Rhodospirillaceae bacterium]
MGAIQHLTAEDGHRFAAYRANPVGTPRGGIVLLQEIYGVNTHLRGLADAYADEGFVVIVPALFDRAEKGVELDYAEAGAEHGCFLRDTIGWDAPLLDIEATHRVLAPLGKVAVIGESYGATLAWRAAAQLPIAAAVCLSPGHLADFLNESPSCPVLIHFGLADPKTPAPLRDQARTTPGVETHDHDAEHAFTCPHRAGFNASATRTAEILTKAFIDKYLS